jgi:hypothetical protein
MRAARAAGFAQWARPGHSSKCCLTGADLSTGDDISVALRHRQYPRRSDVRRDVGERCRYGSQAVGRHRIAAACWPCRYERRASWGLAEGVTSDARGACITTEPAPDEARDKFDQTCARATPQVPVNQGLHCRGTGALDHLSTSCQRNGTPRSACASPVHVRSASTDPPRSGLARSDSPRIGVSP